MIKNNSYDVIVIGAGAAGLMTAVTAGKRGRRVLLIEHTNKIGEKIRISGGGRCNFTNLYASSQNYLGQNPHFMKSALAGYTQHDFIKLVESYKIAYHEKTLGQLFCDGSSQQIINLFLDLCSQFHVTIQKNCTVTQITKQNQFQLITNIGNFEAQSLVIACGGLSIPQIGATDFGYGIAKQFNLKIISTRPALVPLIVTDSQRSLFTDLSGVSNASIVRYKKIEFRENILFTHKGLSGPAILQISSYLEQRNGEVIHINLLPDIDLKDQFMRDKNSKKTLANYLKPFLSNRLVDHFSKNPAYHKTITELKKDTLFSVADQLHNFPVSIFGTEGYKKAEVTAGGVDTNELSSKTMESKKVPDLYFVGEVVDVTGWLGGYNFQWAWSSGFAAGSYC